MIPLVSATDVTKRYKQLTAVDSVSLEVRAGECVGLLGPNGAGKSTMISMIYGAAPRSGGTLSVFGLDPMKDGRKIRRRLGVVTQENALDEALSVKENMIVYAAFSGLTGRVAETRIDELLEFMSLGHKAAVPIRTLSGGMQRRLVFVRALLADPELIILDEPTTGLDPAVRQLLWQKVTELKGRGCTVLLTTHYMDEAERLCDRIIIMDQGKICAQGSPRELIERNGSGFVAIFDASPEAAATILRAATLAEITAKASVAPTLPRLIRPANLEDVFLKITGRELNDNA